MPGTSEGFDIDATFADGEIPQHSSPTPIAASAAISTVKTTAEIIKPPAPEKGSRLMLTLEHRAASPPDPMEIELFVDEASGCAHLRVCDRAAAFASREQLLADSIVELLAREDRAMPRTGIRAELRVNNARLGTALEQLSTAGRIERAAEGWTLT